MRRLAGCLLLRLLALPMADRLATKRVNMPNMGAVDAVIPPKVPANQPVS